MFALRTGASQLAARSAAASTAAARAASTLVVSEPTHDGTLPASTLSAITAAAQLDGGSGDITLLALSDGSHPPVDPSAVPAQVNKSILQVKLDGGSGSLLAEAVAEAVRAAAACGTFTHVVAASSKFGANFVPRAGALLGVSPVPDVVEILGEGT
jgi:electron transfer flavoprotein alpha subunit